MGFENVSKVGAGGLEGCFPFAKFQMQDARFLAPGDGALFQQAPCKARESGALGGASQGDKLQGREAGGRARASECFCHFPPRRPCKNPAWYAQLQCVSERPRRGCTLLLSRHVHVTCQTLRAPFQTKSTYDGGYMKERSEGKRKKEISAHFPRCQQKVRINAKPSICATPLHTMPNVGTSRLHIQ